MVSPSSFITSRKTPWVEGCWGPKLTTRLPSSVSMGKVEITSLFIEEPPGAGFAGASARVSRHPEVGNQDEVRVLLEVLAQGVAREVVGQQYPPQIRVPGEDYPHQVVNLPLLILRPCPQRHERRGLRVLLPGETAAQHDGEGGVGPVDVVHQLKAVLPVHRGYAHQQWVAQLPFDQIAAWDQTIHRQRDVQLIVELPELKPRAGRLQGPPCLYQYPREDGLALQRLLVSFFHSSSSSEGCLSRSSAAASSARTAGHRAWAGSPARRRPPV